jgi:hypothetical protein
LLQSLRLIGSGLTPERLMAPGVPTTGP